MNKMKLLALLFATLISSAQAQQQVVLTAGAPGQQTITLQPRQSVLVVAGTTPPPTCSPNVSPTPNACADNPTPAAGSTIHVSAVGTAGTTAASLSFNYTGEIIGLINKVPINGDGVYAMTVPTVPSDRPLTLKLQFAAADDSFVADGQLIKVSATTTQALGPTLPPSVAADPFIPAHVITVCTSGCQFDQINNAVQFAQGKHWDFVEVTVEPGEIDYDPTHPSGNFVQLDTTAIPHIWVKGIIGNSGTDGTVFPHISGFTTTGGLLLSCVGTGHGIVDNMEFGPFPGALLSQSNCALLTLRNVYIHDSHQGLISGDSLHNSLELFNVHFARNGGQSHNLYQGQGDGASYLHITNSIFEQAFVGHDIKSRSSETDVTNSLIIMNSDDINLGSEVIDASNGYILRVHNNVFVNGPGGGDSYSDNQSFDTIRFSADDCCGPILSNNFVDAQNNIFVSDGGTARQFINLFKPLKPSPPYLARGNKFVFRNADQQARAGGQWQRNSCPPATDCSAIVFGNPSHPPGGNATDINLGTLGTDNINCADRASCGLPPVGTYPKAYNDPAYAISAGTEYVGNVKLPRH
jgi:hypothetical protein